LTPVDLDKTFSLYVTEARRLQAQFKNDIHILVGAETEYIHSDSIPRLLQLIKQYQLDYVVGSIHHVEGIPIDFSEELFRKAEIQCQELLMLKGDNNHHNNHDISMNGTEELFCRYFDLQYELLHRVKPQVIGHFDLCRMYRPNFPLTQRIWEKIKRNINVIIAYEGLIEINSRAWKKGLPGAYPMKDILEVCKILKESEKAI